MNISDFFFYLKTRFKNVSLKDPINPTVTSQENPRDAQSVKSFNDTFEQQQKQTQARTTIGHEKDCKDIFSCKGCFKWEPDKIVGKKKVVPRKTKEQRTKKMIEKDKKLKEERSKVPFRMAVTMVDYINKQD